MNTGNFSISETVAALGVIASLLFVGYEIRQGNEVARNESLSAMSAGWEQTQIEMAGNEYLSGLMARSYSASPSEFDETEQMAFINLMLGLLKSREMWFHQLKLGVIEPTDRMWPPSETLFWRSELQHAYWPTLRKWVSEDFAVFWEQRFELAD
jgi:hypothetical protein